ncbi:MAG: SRPBCC domain-containing protein [Candidatus Acidiferrum sp.]
MSDRSGEISKSLSRRDFSWRVGSMLSGMGIVGIPAFAKVRAEAGGFSDDDGITHTSDAIHQEVAFKASQKRVYEALTNAKQFDQVVRLSGAVKTGMVADPGKTEINAAVGGTFSFFGGYVSGINVELAPSERIVQAWRAGSWKPGEYSIARFELTEDGAGTRLIFDHTGFPSGTAEHLAAGWKMNYWEPLGKYLS